MTSINFMNSMISMKSVNLMTLMNWITFINLLNYDLQNFNGMVNVMSPLTNIISLTSINSTVYYLLIYMALYAGRA